MRKLDPHELGDDVRIYRRVHKRTVKFVDGAMKPDRSVYKKRAGGEQPSAYRGDQLGEDPVAVVLENRPDDGLVSISAGRLRELGQELWEDIDSEDANEVRGRAHLVIDGPKSGSARADLVEASVWERKPPPVNET